MSGNTNLEQLLSGMQPMLHEEDYVFCTVPSWDVVDLQKITGFFKEAEGFTIIVEKKWADSLQLSYTYIAAWISLTVHSSLDAVGLTAAFSSALASEGISCNVVAAFYHDHIFVNRNDANRAMNTLLGLAAKYR